MKFVRYKLSRLNSKDWDFDEVTFSRINLIVGDSGTGKTRFLNIIFNCAQQIVAEKVLFEGKWDIDFEIDDKLYNYNLVVKDTQQGINQKFIEYEELTNKSDQILLVKRENDLFYWKDKKQLKLSKNISSIVIFQEEAPDGHLKIPHLWPGQNPPPQGRQNGGYFSFFSFLTQVF